MWPNFASVIQISDVAKFGMLSGVALMFKSNLVTLCSFPRIKYVKFVRQFP